MRAREETVDFTIFLTGSVFCGQRAVRHGGGGGGCGDGIELYVEKCET